MEELTKLQLDNNIITQIQGLETLTKLTWLDLSFNMIEEIKGLENLRLLEDLSLFSNRITELRGLDNLENLNVLSVGSNEISNLEDSVKYLHRLRNNLEVLKINNNAFEQTGEKEYKGRIIAYLKNLKYLDYELIEANERQKADNDFKTELEGATLENEEQKDTTESKEAYKALEEAHIHHTQNLFNNCMESFDEYDKISKFKRFGDVVQYSDPNIDDCLQGFQQAIKMKQKEKKTKINFCENKMRQAERNAEVESIKKIEAYKKAEKHIFREINKKRAELEENGLSLSYDSYESKLLELIETLKGDLLDIEMALQQTLEGARSQFFTEVKKINDDMGALQTDAFQNISNEFQQFGIKLKEELNKERESFQARIDNDDLALEEYGFASLEAAAGSVIDILIDDQNKDAVDELVTQFIEKIEADAASKDSQITKGRQTEWNQITKSIYENQHSRGRQIISEII